MIFSISQLIDKSETNPLDENDNLIESDGFYLAFLHPVALE